MATSGKPIVLITGAAGGIGSALAEELHSGFEVVGLDVKGKTADFPLIEIDLADKTSVKRALEVFARDHGSSIAAVIHLAAYFDFTGEDNPLYDKVNVDGTRNLLEALQAFEVERFIYSGTMLVHRAGEPGDIVNEDTPLEPKWAYPISKAKAEDAIRAHRGNIPVLLLHLAGVYDDESAVPTLAQQIARIYERDMKSRLYAGDKEAGQAFLHRDDMMRLFRLAVEKRAALPDETVLVAGEDRTVSYENLQHLLGHLIHGKDEWATISLPKPLAKVGAWVEEKAEPIIPDAIDKGEKPFIRPFMIDMADDHYQLDITRARKQLGWEPNRGVVETLPKIVAALTSDPHGWYEKNGVAPPLSMQKDKASAG